MAEGRIAVLTLYAPWAWAYCHLGKDVENRIWRRSPDFLIGKYLAIHAGSPSRWSTEDKRQVAEVAITANPEKWQARRNEFNQMPTWEYCSHIVAVAKVTAILSPDRYPVVAPARSWWMRDCYGIHTPDVVVLKQPIPTPGQQGLWYPSDEVYEQLREQYRLSRGAKEPEQVEHKLEPVEQLSMFPGFTPRLDFD